MGQPWVEFSSAWDGQQLMPEDSGPSYGRNICHTFNMAAYHLLINHSQAVKEPLMYDFIQKAIDIHDYVRNGGRLFADGGWKQGRKLPVVFAAYLMNEAGLKATAASERQFPEDSTTWILAQADVGRAVQLSDTQPERMYTQEMVGMGEWGIRHSENPFADNAQWNANYRSVNGGGLSASAIFTQILGARTLWSWEPFFRYHFDRYIPAAGGYASPGNGIASNSIHRYAMRMFDAYVDGGGVPPPPPPPPQSQTAPPIFTPDGGNFPDPVQVGISCSTAEAAIYYTTDGSVPTAASPLYSGAVTVASSATLNAIGIAPGKTASTVASATFSIGTFGSGDEWQNISLPARTGNFVASFTLTPMADNIDGVTGLGGAAAQNYTDLCAIVRFSPVGIMDVRDGGSYRADTVFNYRAGVAYKVDMFIDLVNKRYTVHVTTPGSYPVRIAENYAFRTELADLSVIANMGFRTIGAEHRIQDVKTASGSLLSRVVGIAQKD
jgi:hypothetical protein